MRTAHSLLRFVSLLVDLTQDALLFLLLGRRSFQVESQLFAKENVFRFEGRARDTKPRRASNATRLPWFCCLGSLLGEIL